MGRGVEDMSEYKRYENGITITRNLTHELDNEDGNAFYKYIPEREFMDLQKKGFEDNHTELLYENDMLRACILRLQSELNNFMVDFIQNIRQCDADTKILNHLAFDKFQMIKLKPMQMSLPSKVNGDRTAKILSQNVDRFKRFLQAYLNPTDVYTILAEANKDLDYDNQVLTFDDLSSVINQWKNMRIK